MSSKLKIYLYPSPHGVNWKSPFHLTWSVLRNGAFPKPRPIGHVTVRVLDSNDHETAFTGMVTPDFKTNRKMILLQGYGMGVLYHSYRGQLETPEKLHEEWKSREQSAHAGIIEIKISEAQRKRIEEYLQAYQNENVDQVYGLPMHPLRKEGAGCSAFTAGVLQAAGLMHREFQKHWSKAIWVPEVFLGKIQAPEKRVPLWRLIVPSRLNLQWASAKDSARCLFFWDPDLMMNWVSEIVSLSDQDRKNRMRCSTRVIQKSPIPVLELDFSDRVIPTKTFFLD